MPEQVTYLDLLFYLWNSGVADDLDARGMMIAHAILWKWNCLRRPKTFPMYNRELADVAHVKDYSHISRLRDRVIHNCQIDGKPLFTYKNRGTRRAGIYSITPDYTTLDQIKPDYTTLPPETQTSQRSEIRNRDQSIPTTTTVYTSDIPVPATTTVYTNDIPVVVGIASDILEVQKAAKNRWPDLMPLDGVPPDSKVRWAIEQVDGDRNRLLEAMNRMPPPETLKCTSYGDLMRIVVKYAKNTGWGLPDGAEKSNGKYLLKKPHDPNRFSELVYELKVGCSMRIDNAKELVGTYEWDYLRRNMRQIKRDYEAGKRYRSPGDEVYKRVKAGYEPPDYPERS